jgi:hypothetical protein
MKSPSKNVLRIGSGNVYIANQTPRAAVRLAMGAKAHSWGWSEAGNIVGLLSARKGYDALSYMGTSNPRDSNDCAMVVRKGLEVEHFSMTRVCSDVPGTKIGQPRVFSMLAYRAPALGGAVVCHVAIHPNWVVGLTSPSNPVVREYVESMLALRRMLSFARAMGWVIVVTGDFNTRRRAKKNYLTVYDIFKEFDLVARVANIDGAAWDKRLRLTSWKVIPTTQIPGGDHPWVVADFMAKPRARLVA